MSLASGIAKRLSDKRKDPGELKLFDDTALRQNVASEWAGIEPDDLRRIEIFMVGELPQKVQELGDAITRRLGSTLVTDDINVENLLREYDIAFRAFDRVNSNEGRLSLADTSLALAEKLQDEAGLDFFSKAVGIYTGLGATAGLEIAYRTAVKRVRDPKKGRQWLEFSIDLGTSADVYKVPELLGVLSELSTDGADVRVADIKKLRGHIKPGDQQSSTASAYLEKAIRNDRMERIAKGLPQFLEQVGYRSIENTEGVGKLSDAIKRKLITGIDPTCYVFSADDEQVYLIRVGHPDNYVSGLGVYVLNRRTINHLLDKNTKKPVRAIHVSPAYKDGNALDYLVDVFEQKGLL